jgi:hypothetical protein
MMQQRKLTTTARNTLSVRVAEGVVNRPKNRVEGLVVEVEVEVEMEVEGRELPGCVLTA